LNVRPPSTLFLMRVLYRLPSGLYSLKEYWYAVAPYGADIDRR